MPDKHIVIQKFNSKQCDVARLASGHKNEYWVVATAPNVDVARGLVTRLNSAPEPVAPAIEGKAAYKAKRKAAQEAESAKLRKEYKLSSKQLAALTSLNASSVRLPYGEVSNPGTLPSLKRRGLVGLDRDTWLISPWGVRVLKAYEEK